jgi:hypothetical protein
MASALRRIASINLKKASGQGWSDMSEVGAHARHDRELLIEQIDTIKPDVMVACGTFEILAWVLDLRFAPGKSGPVHPARADNRAVYDELKRLCEPTLRR